MCAVAGRDHEFDSSHAEFIWDALVTLVVFDVAPYRSRT